MWPLQSQASAELLASACLYACVRKYISYLFVRRLYGVWRTDSLCVCAVPPVPLASRRDARLEVFESAGRSEAVRAFVPLYFLLFAVVEAGVAAAAVGGPRQACCRLSRRGRVEGVVMSSASLSRAKKHAVHLPPAFLALAVPLTRVARGGTEVSEATRLSSSFTFVEAAEDLHGKKNSKPPPLLVLSNECEAT